MTIDVTGVVKVNSGNTVKTSESLAQSAITVTEFSSTTVVVPASTSDLAMPVSLINPAQYLFLKTDLTVNIKLNGSSDAITMATGGILSLTGTVSALTVTNSDLSNDATVTMIIAG